MNTNDFLEGANDAFHGQANRSLNEQYKLGYERGAFERAFILAARAMGENFVQTLQ